MKIYWFKVARKDGFGLFDRRQLGYSHGKCRTQFGWLHVIAIPFFVLMVGIRP